MIKKRRKWGSCCRLKTTETNKFNMWSLRNSQWRKELTINDIIRTRGKLEYGLYIK